MLRTPKQLLSILSHSLFPHLCCHCGKAGRYLCRSCAAQVDFHIQPFTLPDHSTLTSITAAFTHTPPVSDLITTLKYQYIKDIAYYLGELLYLHTHYPNADVITFVPLATDKQRMRGFNQAEQIATAFGHHANIPVIPLLQRTHNSQTSQASLSSKYERLLNTDHQAFRYNAQIRAPSSVLLIDDVYTTGSTLEACATVLKDYGANHVHGLVVAHGS